MNVNSCIVSFPRSGRHLTHKALASGFSLPLGHMDRANPKANSRRLVVSHNIQPEIELDGRHCIVLIRDPFEALSSFLHLEWPEDATVSRFLWALEDQGGNSHSTSKNNWLKYYRSFVRHHVLPTNYPYQCPRLILGYKQFMENPRDTLQGMVDFVGGEFDWEACFKATGQIDYKHNRAEGPLAEVKPLIDEALAPEIRELQWLGLI